MDRDDNFSVFCECWYKNCQIHWYQDCFEYVPSPGLVDLPDLTVCLEGGMKKESCTAPRFNYRKMQWDGCRLSEYGIAYSRAVVSLAFFKHSPTLAELTLILCKYNAP